MASKRKRKLEKKSSTEFQEKMKARRASANDALWTYGKILNLVKFMLLKTTTMMVSP